MFRRLALILPLALLAATPLLALEKGEMELALGADYYLLDSKAGLDNALAPRARFGVALSDRVELALAYRRIDTEDGFGGSVEFEPQLDLATLDLVWSFGEDDFQPFAFFGAGWGEGDYVIEEGKKILLMSDSGYVGDLGVGCRWRISRHFVVRVDTMVSAWSAGDETFFNLSAGLDFAILFGKSR